VLALIGEYGGKYIPEVSGDRDNLHVGRYNFSTRRSLLLQIADRPMFEHKRQMYDVKVSLMGNGWNKEEPFYKRLSQLNE